MKTTVKVLGLSIVLGFIWYLLSKASIDPKHIDDVNNGSYIVLNIVWFLFLWLPISLLCFCTNKVWRILGWIFVGIGIFLIISAIIMAVFFRTAEMSHDVDLFTAIFTAPFTTPMVLMVLLGGGMH